MRLSTILSSATLLLIPAGALADARSQQGGAVRRREGGGKDVKARQFLPPTSPSLSSDAAKIYSELESSPDQGSEFIQEAEAYIEEEFPEVVAEYEATEEGSEGEGGIEYLDLDKGKGQGQEQSQGEGVEWITEENDNDIGDGDEVDAELDGKPIYDDEVENTANPGSDEIEWIDENEPLGSSSSSYPNKGQGGDGGEGEDDDDESPYPSYPYPDEGEGEGEDRRPYPYPSNGDDSDNRTDTGNRTTPFFALPGDVFTEPLITSLLVVLFVLMPILGVGIMALMSIQVPPYMMAISKTTGPSQTKKDQ